MNGRGKRFVDKYPYDKRREVASKMLASYPDRVPMIVEAAKSHNLDLPSNLKTKYLVPREITIGRFLLTLRTQIKLQPEQAMFLFVNETLPPVQSLVDDIYGKHKSSDGFLYVIFAGENAYGSNT